MNPAQNIPQKGYCPLPYLFIVYYNVTIPRLPAACRLPATPTTHRLRLCQHAASHCVASAFPLDVATLASGSSRASLYSLSLYDCCIVVYGPPLFPSTCRRLLLTRHYHYLAPPPLDTCPPTTMPEDSHRAAASRLPAINLSSCCHFLFPSASASASHLPLVVPSQLGGGGLYLWGCPISNSGR